MLHPVPTVTHVTVVDGDVADKYFHGDANLVEIHRHLWAGRRRSACSNLVHIMYMICAKEAIASFDRSYLANQLAGSVSELYVILHVYLHASTLWQVSWPGRKLGGFDRHLLM